MSLLISALQKAEQGRKQSVDKADVEDFLLELAPQEENKPGTDTDQATHDAEQENTAKQKAAAQLLSAKAGAVKLDTRISPLMMGLLLLSLLLMVGAGVFWYLSSLAQPEVMVARPVSMPAAVAPGVGNNVTQENATQDGVTQNNASQDNATVDNAGADEIAPNALAPNERAIAPPLAEAAQDQLAAQTQTASQARPDSSLSGAVAKATLNTSQNTAQAMRQAIPQPGPAVPAAFGEPLTSSEASRVSVSKNRPATGVSREVMTAYEAFNRGDDKAAQQAYRQALQADVRNIDALLGMAAVAVRQGRQADALAWYGKVLELEPRNITAQTALLELQGQADPQSSESRLKTMISLNPQAAHLHAALGQQYIGQAQWPLAQQSFFEAHHLDATNPEYAFNLAVSLDHMGKPALALQYYLQAQALLLTHAATSVDQAQLATRIQQLQ